MPSSATFTVRWPLSIFHSIETLPPDSVYFMAFDNKLSTITVIFFLSMNPIPSDPSALSTTFFAWASGVKLHASSRRNPPILVSSTLSDIASLSIFWKSNSWLTILRSLSAFFFARFRADLSSEPKMSVLISWRGALIRVSGVRKSWARFTKNLTFWSESRTDIHRLYNRMKINKAPMSIMI